MIEPIQLLLAKLITNQHRVRSPRVEVRMTYIPRPLIARRGFKGFSIPKLTWVTFDLSGGVVITR